MKRSNRYRFEIYKDILVACCDKTLTRYRIWRITMSECSHIYKYIELLKRQGLLLEEVEVRDGMLKKVYRATNKGIELIDRVNKIKSLLGEMV